MANRQIVLTGFIGSGKTTFFNLICNTNQPVKSGGKSLTRQTFLKEAAYGSGFRVLDTPGYASKEEKIIHAVGVLNAIQEGPLNQIFLIVKWDRIDYMTDFIKNMVVKFSRYKHLLTVAVTHWDTADQQTLAESQEEFIQLCTRFFGLYYVIFVSKFDSGEKVCAEIDYILDLSQAENVQLTESEIYSNFDLIELKSEIELQLEFEKENVLKSFNKTAIIIKKFIKDFDEKNPSMNEIMHCLALETKKIAENIISEFEIKNNEKFTKLFEYHNNPSLAYLVHFELKKQLISSIEQIIELTQNKMKGDKNHFFNFIKACPYCGIIWLKVAGCGGLTTCGEFPIKDEYFNNHKMPSKYDFNITEKGINYSINKKFQQKEDSVKWFMDKDDFILRILKNKNSLFSQKQYKEPQKKKRKGCGQPIVWDKIPPLSARLLKELIDPGLMDYFAQEVPKEELQKTLMKAQKSVQSQVDQAKKDTKVIKL